MCRGQRRCGFASFRAPHAAAPTHTRGPKARRAWERRRYALAGLAHSGLRAIAAKRKPKMARSAMRSSGRRVCVPLATSSHCRGVGSGTRKGGHSSVSIPVPDQVSSIQARIWWRAPGSQPTTPQLGQKMQWEAALRSTIEAALRLADRDPANLESRNQKGSRTSKRTAGVGRGERGRRVLVQVLGCEGPHPVDRRNVSGKTSGEKRSLSGCFVGRLPSSVGGCCGGRMRARAVALWIGSLGRWRSSEKMRPPLRTTFGYMRETSYPTPLTPPS